MREPTPYPELDAGSLVLLTGAAGGVGTLLRRGLEGIVPLRLTDMRRIPGGPGDEVVGDLADPAVADAAVRGTRAIVHLAAHPRPDVPWDVLARSNLQTTATLLDAASRHGVRTIVLASSVHAAGGYGDPAEWPVQPTWPARPCCRYGVSKVASEELLGLHARENPHVSAVALRLGLVADQPRWTEEVRGWTPSTDIAPLVTSALRAQPGYRVYFAVTTAERPRYATEGIRTDLGYRSSASDHLSGPLNDNPPAYFADCTLWRHPAFLASLQEGRHSPSGRSEETGRGTFERQ